MITSRKKKEFHHVMVPTCVLRAAYYRFGRIEKKKQKKRKALANCLLRQTPLQQDCYPKNQDTRVSE